MDAGMRVESSFHASRSNDCGSSPSIQRLTQYRKIRSFARSRSKVCAMSVPARYPARRITMSIFARVSGSVSSPRSPGLL